MARIGKKLAAVLLALALVVAFLAVFSTQEVYAADYPKELSVGYRDSNGEVHSVRLSSAKPGYINGNPEAQALPEGESPINVFNAYYDVENHTLMLNNYRGIGIDEREGASDLLIVLFGKNTIDSKGNNGIYLFGNLEITSRNNGSLTIVNQPTNMSSYGIRSLSDKSVTISGSAVLDITSKVVSDSSTDTPHGIYAGGDVTIKDSAKVTTHSSVSQENAMAWSIYAGRGLNISTTSPIEITAESTGKGGTAYGLYSNYNEISISKIPYIRMDLTGPSRKPYAYVSTLESLLQSIDYYMASQESGDHGVYTIAPKEFVPETVDIQFDRTNLQRLTPDLTGSDAAAYFFPSIQSPHGDVCPEETPEGWYIRMGDSTGFGDDTGDPRDMEADTDGLEWGQPYYFCFEVLTNPGHKWNPDQDFTINGSSENVVVAGYEVDGKHAYQVSLMVVCEDILNRAQMGEVPDVVYSGSAYMPAPVLTYNGETLAKDDHYIITYEDSAGNAVAAPTNAGEYTLVATGDYAFYGTLCTDFAIKPAEITEDGVSGIKDKTYSGKALTQAPVVVVNGVTLKKGTDYTLSYENNINAGTATVIITGKGNYTGTVTKTFTIAPKAVTPKVTLAKTEYTWNGKAQKPAVTVKAGSTTLTTSDYKVTYAAGRKNVGKYTVKVTLKGNYSGTKTVSFKINPKGTTLKTLTAASKAITVKWTKQATKMSSARITGYQIQIATDSKFTKNAKSYTVKGYATVSKKLTKLTGNKKYYVRIRTYTKTGGANYYSPWSKAKTVTTKK